MRRELKIRAPAQKLIDIEYKIKSSNLLMYREYDDRIVNSIYLDDIYLTSMDENIQGISNRTKWRLRWYNSCLEKASLERKKKFGYAGNKENYNIYLAPNIQTFSEIKKAIETQLSKSVIIQITNLAPVVKVVYTRSYWRSKLHDVRLTVDREIRYYRTNNYRKFGMEIPLNVDAEVLMEVKYPDTSEGLITNLFSDFNLITSRNSKYARAISRSL